MISPDQHDLLALCALREEKSSVDWSLLAREAVRSNGLADLLAGHIAERSAVASRSRRILRRLLPQLDRARERVDSELALAEQLGARLVTVLDDGYPSNLRLIPNLPPFLFVLGDEFHDDDLRSVAVVGTRKPSPDGLRRARRMAEQLVDHGVTVVSGMAAGIDTAAHRATLDVGGRTIAVTGTGITRTYPKENAALAAEIAEHGAIVSQFWPSTPPATWTFPRRNVVMSGIAQGTVVIEASQTSGAKMQARLALEHGKRVFLVRTLVTSQPWAGTYVAERGAVEVGEVDDVIRHLAEPDRIRSATEQRQLTLDLT
jgi:DNA processing protein